MRILMNRHEVVRQVRKHLQQIKDATPENGWLCWKCGKPNHYSDVRTQVERNECCIYACVKCGEEEHPF